MVANVRIPYSFNEIRSRTYIRLLTMLEDIILEDKKIFAGLAGVAGVLLLVALLRPEPQVEEAAVDVKDLIASELAPVADAVTALESRITDVQGSLDALSEQAASREDLDAVQSSIAEITTQSGELSAALSDLRLSVTQDGPPAQAPVADADTPAPADAETVAAPEPVADAPAETAEAAATEEADTTADAPAADTTADAAPIKVGQTAVFADGAMRVFVSMLDTDAATARLSVGGTMKMMDAGSARTVAVGESFCRISVGDITQDGAAISAICGDDLPAPEGITVGETAVLKDGALRVFASMVQENAARLSVNGDLAMMDVGRSVPVMVADESCRVALDAVDRGHATVSVACGDEVAVSAPISPGATAVLGDGAARVFLASVSDAGAARFAVNGQTLVTGASGAEVMLGEGCAITVEDVVANTASFSYGCN